MCTQATHGGGSELRSAIPAINELGLTAVNAGLRAYRFKMALERYGKHDAGCGADKGKECSCGLAKFLAEPLL